MFSVKKYEPRKAAPDEACRYFLSYHSDAPDALFGTMMEKEACLNADTPGWLREAQPSQRWRVAAGSESRESALRIEKF